ncbi:MAG: SdpI family protein [Clostridia bacterium]|nr:SdpI family protein [Clostridia bacterium]
MKIGTLKVTTFFNMVIFICTVIIIALDKATIIEMSESDDKLLAMIIISAVILFGGFVFPRLPFNRHTGLRLPWTVQDEDTWNVAHKIIGYISFPVVLLYLAASFTLHNFEAITVTIMLLWIGIPGFFSFIFWWKKYRSKS